MKRGLGGQKVLQYIFAGENGEGLEKGLANSRRSKKITHKAPARSWPRNDMRNPSSNRQTSRIELGFVDSNQGGC
jgi:hypothetical protein